MMNKNASPEQVEVIVIGAGQAGLATGYYLAQAGHRFVILDVANVIWATGFYPDYRWISLPIFGADGYPLHKRGVVEGEPGLYFVGLRFLYRPASHLVGGVGADAQYVVHAINERQSSL
jgi:hypothetical protein